MRYIALFVLMMLCAAIGAVAQAQVDVSHDSSSPVEITADSLEVLQEDQVAVFSGNVEAIQGELNIRADKMTVHYRDSKNKKAKQDSVSKIETDGHVFLSGPKETAQGDKGMYDVDQKTVTLTGKVVLTSGKNVVKGEKLVYNIATGQSRMVSGNGGSSGKKERVRGVFVPNDTKN